MRPATYAGPGDVPRGMAPPALRDLLLVCLTFSSGAVDAISFLGLGRVFTANMTGNIVLLGLAVGRGAGAEVVRAGVSLVAFAAGVFVSSRVAGRADSAGLWPRRVTVALAFEALAQAGFLTGWLAGSGHPAGALEATLVGLSAVAMGMQSGAVGALGVSGVSTTYVTGTMTGLIGEIASSAGVGSDRLRRGGVLAAMLFGAAVSGLLLHGARRLAPVLPLLVTLAVIAAAGYVRAPAGSVKPGSADADSRRGANP